MISAIESARLANVDNRVGRTAPAPDEKFSAILNTASRRDPTQSLAKYERPVSPSEAEPRSIYGGDAKPRAQITRGEDREAEQARRHERLGVPTQDAQKAANTETAAQATAATDDVEGAKQTQEDKDRVLDTAEAPAATGDELAGVAMQPGVVLTFQDIINQSNARVGNHRSISVQLGMAAYHMSPHSAGEAELAQMLGAAPAPDFTKTIDPKGALDPRNAIRTPSDLKPADIGADPVLVVDALSMVKLSNEAQAARAAAANPQLAEAPEGSAMARDEFLAQIGKQTTTAPLSASAGPAMSVQMDAAKDLLAPAKEPAVKSTDAPATTAPVVPVNGGVIAAQASDRPQLLTTEGPGESRMLDKIVQEARWLIRGNKQEVTMRLEPEHLGSLKLHVTHKDGAMRIEMTVDNAAAKQMLDQSMSQLRERFAQENLAQGSMLHVDVRQGGNSEFAQQFGKQGSEAGGSAAGIRSAVPTEDTTTTAPRAAWSNSNVSIYA